MQIAELVQLGISELTAAGIPDCASDVYLLLGHSFGMSRTQLLLGHAEDVSCDQKKAFLTLLERRKKREPVAYILGEQEFWSKSFLVNRSVLIPRPETEFMLETVFKDLKRTPLPENSTIVDLCCGSGVIAIILALELKRKVIGIDLSADALEVARKNCTRNETGTDVVLVQSDLFENVSLEAGTSLVVSNPPYVSTHSVLNEVEPEVGLYEPKMALDGGEKGLDIIERIRLQLPHVLMPGGRIFMEIGYDQGENVAELFRKPVYGLRDFRNVEIHKDYAGRDRVLQAVIS